MTVQFTEMAKPNAQTGAPLPPIVDERILIRGTSYLRTINSDSFEEMQRGTVVVIKNGADADRIGVLLRYDDYMALQQAAFKP